MSYLSIYEEWCKKATEDADVAFELKAMEGDDEKIEDALNTLDSKKKLLNKEIEMNSKSKKTGFFNY